jgi:hypothetical protein
MSAVIWCGIVAVWIFVLIPTWVRRGDIHWRRGAPVMAQGPVESPQDSEDSGDVGDERGRRLRVPGMRLMRRSRADQALEVETMAEQVAQPPTERVQTTGGAPAPRVRVAAAPSSGRLGGAMRASFGTGPGGSGRKKPPIRVRRARRLVGLAALALGTLIVAIAAGGLWIAVTIVADIALILYIRHLRAIAKERQAKAAREKRARIARQAWEKASAQERASQLDGWRAPAAEPVAESFTEDYEADYEVDEIDGAPTHIDLTGHGEQQVIDLSDAPTEELITARVS